jgi:TPR repeat protein
MNISRLITSSAVLAAFALLVAAYTGYTKINPNLDLGVHGTSKSLDVSELENTARHGDDEAEKMLSELFYQGSDLPQTHEEVTQWHQRMADAGFADAELRVGDIYKNSTGVPLDFNEALKWYRISANTGNAFAQNNIGEMYYRGEGVSKDFLKSYMWLDIAENNGHQEAHILKGVIALNMSPSQIQDAKGRSREWQTNSMELY